MEEIKKSIYPETLQCSCGNKDIKKVKDSIWYYCNKCKCNFPWKA